MIAFTRANGVAVEVTGSWWSPSTTPSCPDWQPCATAGLATAWRARDRPDEAVGFEPHVRCVRAVHVPSTGIVDFGRVYAALVRQLEHAGADLLMKSPVVDFHWFQLATVVEQTSGDVEAGAVVNCAALQSDRVACLAGVRPDARIAGQRGINRTGAEEMPRSVSRHRFGASLRRLAQDIADDDLETAEPVRAQAISSDGRLVDDFLIERDARMVHVLNAPSSAAMSALQIAEYVFSLVG